MSKYDNIETVAELVAEVRANGLSEEIDDLASIQEIFDGTPTDELIRLICDIGQDTEHMAFEEVKAENARLRAAKAELEDKVETLRHEQEMQTREMEKLRSDERSMIAALEDAEADVVNLKAELYDYMKAVD